MATQESIHQGWLYARDGKKFAPITLIDDVYAMNGKKYKDVVTQQINNITAAQNTSLTSINQTLGQHTTDIEALENADKEILAKLTNFGDDGTDALYIVDKSNNVIAYINGLGVHSIDFTLPNENQFSLKDFINNKYASFVTSTNTTLSTLIKKLENFGDDGDNTSFYIVDQYNNVIAYFDETGANSINFTTPSGNLNQVISDLSQEIKDRTKLETVTVAANTTAINSIKKDIQYFNAGDTDTELYIIDKNNNVMAYVDETGLHSLNVYSKNFDLEGTNARVKVIEDTTIPNVVSDLTAAYQTADTSIRNWINNEKLVNFGDDTGDTLFIVDKSNNVMAYIDETGLHSLNVHSKNYNMETHIKDLYDKVATEVSDRTSAISSLKTAYETADNIINNRITNVDTAIRKDFAAADTALESSLTKAYKAADSALESSLTEDYKAADAALKQEITTAYQTADTSIRSNVSSNTSQIADINNRLQYFNLDGDSTALYIIDKNNNVIAYFDEKGLTAHNVMFSNARNLVCYGNSPSVVTYNFTI